MESKFVFLQVLVLAVFCLLPGCTSSSRWRKVHPMANRLPPDSSVSHQVNVSRHSKVRLPFFLNPDSLQSVATIGSKKDSSFDKKNYYYGDPPKMDIDNRGNIYVLQKQSNCIRVYNKKGTYLYQIGRKGRGPGEFTQIKSFAFGSDYKKLFVADASYKIVIFVLRKERYTYQTTDFVNFIQINDLCTLGNDLFVSGYQIARKKDRKAYQKGGYHYLELKAAKPITEIDLKTLKQVLSFGYVYKSYSGFGAYTAELSQAMLGCNKYTGTIVDYMKNFPFIIGYDHNGHEKWISKMDGYVSAQFIEFKKPGYLHPGLMPYVNKTLFNWKYPIEHIHDGPYSLLQFGWGMPQPFFSKKSVSFNREIKTVLVNTRNGKLYYSDEYPFIGALGHNVVITIHIIKNLQKDILKVERYKGKMEQEDIE